MFIYIGRFSLLPITFKLFKKVLKTTALTDFRPNNKKLVTRLSDESCMVLSNKILLKDDSFVKLYLMLRNHLKKYGIMDRYSNDSQMCHYSFFKSLNPVRNRYFYVQVQEHEAPLERFKLAIHMAQFWNLMCVCV